MSTIATLHTEAMDLAETAWIERHGGNVATYRDLIRRAYEKERAAAQSAVIEGSPEPTRSVLLRSAGSLALECGETRDAERLVSLALTGEPPFEIAEELRDLTEQIRLHRHLDTRGIVLHPNQMQVALTGNAIGFGVAESGVFLQRIRDLESLIFRTAERKAVRPFRERGRRAGQIARAVELFVVAPRAGSFTVSLQLGTQDQLGLDGFGFAESVIDEFLDCIDAFQGNDLNKLRGRIPDQAYLLNFINLARNIAPDGDAVRGVAFSVGSHTRTREVLLTRTRDAAPQLPVTPISSDPGETVAVQGSLKFADAIKETENEIGLIDSNLQRHRVLVPPGLMDDIVKPLWDTEVTVFGVKKGNAILLSEIKPLLPPPDDDKSNG